MTGLLICAAVAALFWLIVDPWAWAVGSYWRSGERVAAAMLSALGLALIAVALWLAYAAGAQL